MINLDRLAAAGTIQCTFSQASLDIHHGLGFGRGLFAGITQQLKHFLHMLGKLLADLNGLGIILEVVVLIGKRHPTLIGHSNYLRSILKILVGTKSKKHLNSVVMQADCFVRQLIFRFQHNDGLHLLA